MAHRSSRILVVLVLLLFGGARMASGEEEAGGTSAPWRDASLVESRFAEACETVEETCGAPFGTRPTVRITSRVELREILRREQTPILEAMGLEAEIDAMLSLLTRAIIAKYEPATHTVHVIAERFEDDKLALVCDGPVDEDFLRVVLAHEATHALDWPRHGWTEINETRTDHDARKAFDAVVEGHAQYVAKRVAGSWNIADAFGRFTTSIVTLPPIEQEALRPILEALVAELTFGYVQGHAFMEAVAAARGDEGIEAVLRSPPTTTRLIEHPEEYLDPPADDEAPDLARAIEAFRPLVGAGSWRVLTSRMLESALRAAAQAVPEEQRKTFLAGYLEGRVLMGRIPTENRQVVVFLASFRTADDAQAFLAAERAGQEAKDEAGGVPGLAEIKESTYEDGAGPAGLLPGFVSRKVVVAANHSLEVMTHNFALGRLAGQILIVQSPEIRRADQDAAITRLDRYLADPDAADAAGIFEVPPVQIGCNSRQLTIRVHDEKGDPVPRAWVRAVSKSTRRRSEVVDGQAGIDLPKEPVTLVVWGARDVAGTPLNLAPQAREDVAADLTTVEVVLTEGATIAGSVVEEDGTPVEGVVVWASPAVDDPMKPAPLAGAGPAEATSAADGSFRLVGLVPGRAHDVRVKENDRFAPSRDLRVEVGREDIRIVLTPGTRATVTVMDGKDGPVAGASIWIEEIDHNAEGGWRRWSVRTNAMGHARLPALAPGVVYNLQIRPPRRREDLARYRDLCWTPTDESIRLPAGFTARGIVRDEEGRPVPHAVVRTEDRGIRRGAVTYFDGESTVTDASGRFEIHHVPACPTRLYVARDHSRYRGGDRDEGVEVSPDQSSVVLRLPASPCSVRIRVIGALAGRDVVLRREDGDPDADGRSWNAETDGNGVAAIAALPPGIYTIYVHEKGDGRVAFRRGVEIRGGDVEVDLVDALSLRVVLRVPEGSRYSEVLIECPLCHPIMERLEDHVFVAHGLPPGQWTVKAKVRAPDAWLRAIVEAEAGSEIEIVLPAEDPPR